MSWTVAQTYTFQCDFLNFPNNPPDRQYRCGQSVTLAADRVIEAQEALRHEGWRVRRIRGKEVHLCIAHGKRGV